MEYLCDRGRKNTIIMWNSLPVMNKSENENSYPEATRGEQFEVISKIPTPAAYLLSHSGRLSHYLRYWPDSFSFRSSGTFSKFLGQNSVSFSCRIEVPVFCCSVWPLSASKVIPPITRPSDRHFHIKAVYFSKANRRLSPSSLLQWSLLKDGIIIMGVTISWSLPFFCWQEVSHMF